MALAGKLLRLLLLFAPHLLGSSAFEGVPCNATTIDCGQEFFKEVYRGFQTVQHEVFIMPFFIKPHLKIFSSVEGAPPDTTLEEIIVKTVRRGVHVWILGWDNAASEKYLPYHQDSWYQKIYEATGEDHNHLHLMLDTSRSLLPSVYYLPHIKSYTFDRKVAYVGGMDFAENRLDTPQHVRPNPLLVEVNRDSNHVTGNEKPWQDAMVKMDGQAVGHVAMVLIERWRTYCVSDGYLRSKATRPMDALTNFFYGVDGSLQRSSWKAHICDKLPEAGLLGTLTIQVIKSSEGLRHFTLQVKAPAIQSAGLQQPATQVVHLLPGAAPKLIEVRGFRGLDRALPRTISLNLDGQELEAHSGPMMAQTLQDGSIVTLRWLPDGQEINPGQQLCRVVLSGDQDWMGVSKPVIENYEEHLRLVREAKRFIFIENQYFSTAIPSSAMECADGQDHEAVLYSGAQNKFGIVLLDRLRQAGRNRENFSVSVVIPLATEPGSFYPNLRGTYCFEQAVERMWENEQLHGNWQDYFSFFFIGNAVPVPRDMGGPGSAFYGIFTHTKCIVVDDEVAILGSANINDRSFLGDRDAEVGVKVWNGPYPRELRETLLKGHIGNGTLCEPDKLLACLHAVAAANAGELNRAMGVRFPEGTITKNGIEQPLFGLRSIGLVDVRGVGASAHNNAEIKYPLSMKVAGGGGVDTFYWYTVKGNMPAPRLHGLLFPWSRAIWGLPKMTQVTQAISNEFNWRRLAGNTTDDLAVGDLLV